MSDSNRPARALNIAATVLGLCQRPGDKKCAEIADLLTSKRSVVLTAWRLS
jgi:hypothetical protein